MLKHPDLFGLTLWWMLRGHASVTLGRHKLKFKSPSYGWLRAAQQGKWERGVSDCLTKALGENDIFVDIGANVGAYCLLAAKMVGPGGKVFAFEPDPVARKLLINNVRLNAANNVEVLSNAVSDRSGTAHLVASRFGGMESSIGSVPGATGARQELEVPTTSLDHFCKERGIRPDVVKIDVEGAEGAVFAGGLNTLSEARVIFLEFHPHKIGRDFGISPDQFWAELFRLGKTVYAPGTGAPTDWGSLVCPTDRFNKAVRLVLVSDREAESANSAR